MSWIIGALLLAGCAGLPPVPEVPAGVAADCGDSMPVIDSLVVEDGGIYEFPSGAWPSILLHTEDSDPDGDLHYYALRVFYDEEVDGVVATDGEYTEVSGWLSAGECQIEHPTISMRLAVTGSPPFDTLLEIAVVLLDDLDHASEPAITTFRTPAEDGTY